MSAAPWLLALSVALVNLPRFVLGRLGPLQRTDVADHYIDKFLQCGAWIRSPSEHLWNPGEVRGWGMLNGSVNPQHLGCVLAAALPIEFVFPLLQTLIEILVVVGAYGFARHNLRLAEREAVYAALVFAVIYYGHNENPYVTQIALLPLLVFLTSVEGASVVRRPLQVVGLALVILLSFPFYAVPLMPIAQVALAGFSASPRRTLWRAAWFWAAFTLFYAPNVVAYARLAFVSNRAFFHPGFDTASPASQLPIFLVKALAYPVLAATVVATRRALKPVLWALAFGVVAAAQSAVQQSSMLASIAAHVPLALSFERAIRLFYFVLVAMFLAVAIALRERAPAPRRAARMIAAAALACLIGAITGLMWWPLLGVAFAVIGTCTGLVIVADPLARPRGPAFAMLVMLAVIVPASLGRTAANEAWPYGNLFAAVDETLPASTSPQRFVTVATECYPHRTYAAQVAVRGAETLDGVMAFHDRAFTERWWWYVTRGSTGCTSIFYHWSNRIELIASDVRRRPNLVLAWLRINNVTWIRSEETLDVPGLTLVATTYVPRLLTRDTLCRAAQRVGAGAACPIIWRGAGACGTCTAPAGAACASCFVPIYRYRVEGAFPRAFALAGGAGMRVPTSLADE